MKKFFIKLGIVLWGLSLIPVFAFFLLWAYTVLIEPNWIEINTVRIKDRTLAGALKGITLVHLSDLQIRNFGYRERSLVRKLNKIKPDVILITGDMVSSEKGLDAFFRMFKKINTRIWSYGIYGNTEEYFIQSPENYRWRNAKVTIINDRGLKVKWADEGTGLWLLGSGDLGRYYHDIRPLMNQIPGKEKDLPRILLCHHPDIALEAQKMGVDLVLAGHTHGGQVGMDWLRDYAPYSQRSDFVSGLYQLGKTLLYVNRGIGWSTLPIRFFCRPEITILKFEK